MNYAGLMGWVSLALSVPLLMGAKGGCGADDVSMGNDYAGAAGRGGNESGGQASSGGSAGAMPEGGANATGGTMARGGAGTAGDGVARGGASPESCDGFEDSTFRDEVTVRYVNASTEPLYIGRSLLDGCGSELEFELLDAMGEPLAWKKSGCVGCQGLQRGPLICTTDCPMPLLVRLEPGGSYDYTWSGTYARLVAMPKACYKTQASDTCSQTFQAEASSYSFVGTAWPAFACQPGATCVCNPTESPGACMLHYPAAATGTPQKVTAGLDYPAEKLVELRFE